MCLLLGDLSQVAHTDEVFQKIGRTARRSYTQNEKLLRSKHSVVFRLAGQRKMRCFPSIQRVQGLGKSHAGRPLCRLERSLVCLDVHLRIKASNSPRPVQKNVCVLFAEGPTSECFKTVNQFSELMRYCPTRLQCPLHC